MHIEIDGVIYNSEIIESISYYEDNGYCEKRKDSLYIPLARLCIEFNKISNLSRLNIFTDLCDYQELIFTWKVTPFTIFEINTHHRENVYSRKKWEEFMDKIVVEEEAKRMKS